jgi:hypothetical protein
LEHSGYALNFPGSAIPLVSCVPDTSESEMDNRYAIMQERP